MHLNAIKQKTEKMAGNMEFYRLPPFLEGLFKDGIELIPSVSELFELELGYLENSCLPEKDLLDRVAYIKSVNGKLAKHFLMYSKPLTALTDNRTADTKAYFERGLFSTGYATHGLFPYRGKFHPQLVKALMNIIGIKRGGTILDPMCGSGTANIEAALMGINSYAADLSPFCQFMTRVKYNSLTINTGLLDGVCNSADQLFDLFNVQLPQRRLTRIRQIDKLKVYELVFLAFLDSLGYSKRVVKSNHRELFRRVLRRYRDTVCQFVTNSAKYLRDLGRVTVLENASATKLPLENNMLDGVITSPPYSFAIDYVKNDEPQLSILGCDVDNMREQMIGLRGKNKEERLKNYFSDISLVCSEVSRVLKERKYFVIIIGSNTNQTGGIRLEGKLIESCRSHNLVLVKTILKPIKGLRNTMKDEYILFFQKRSGK